MVIYFCILKIKNKQIIIGQNWKTFYWFDFLF
jgi:hypothetical protein